MSSRDRGSTQRQAYPNIDGGEVSVLFGFLPQSGAELTERALFFCFCFFFFVFPGAFTFMFIFNFHSEVGRNEK